MPLAASCLEAAVTQGGTPTLVSVLVVAVCEGNSWGLGFHGTLTKGSRDSAGKPAFRRVSPMSVFIGESVSRCVWPKPERNQMIGKEVKNRLQSWASEWVG